MGIKAIAPDGKQIELVTKDELSSEGSPISVGIELIMSDYISPSPVTIELPNCNVGDTINLLCLTYAGASETTTLGANKKVSIYSPTPNETDLWLIFTNSILKYVLRAVKRIS